MNWTKLNSQTIAGINHDAGYWGKDKLLERHRVDGKAGSHYEIDLRADGTIELYHHVVEPTVQVDLVGDDYDCIEKAKLAAEDHLNNQKD